MTKHGVRAVIDTNVVIAALKSRNPRSPTREVLDRWEDDEFKWLYSEDLRVEYAEKLVEKQVDPLSIVDFLSRLMLEGHAVLVTKDDLIPRVPADPDDDDAVIACAIVGRATHLVTYDPHLHALGEVYRGVRILDGLHFLYVLRGDTLKA